MNRLKATVVSAIILGLSATALGCFTYGIYVGVYKAFPYVYVYGLTQLIKPPPKADIVFIGDSITVGGVWSWFLPQYNIVNAGAGSATTADILQRLNLVISRKPKIGLIMIGINDVYQNVPTEKIFNNYTQIIRELSRNGILVVIQSTIQCNFRQCGRNRVDKIEHLNRLLKTYSEENKIPFLDLQQLSKNTGLDASLTTDGIHLNNQGYGVWADLLKTELSQFFNSYLQIK